MKYTEGQRMWMAEMMSKANGLATANIPLHEYDVAKLTGEHLAWKINQLPKKERGQAIADLFVVAITQGHTLP